MITEVVVMNKTGIALAADSVISEYSDRGHKKRGNTGSQLFSISDVQPVGVMVYNNASLLGIPWETIITVFRESLGDTCFPRLEEYGFALINFLKQHNTMFPIKAQQRYFLLNFQSVCIQVKNEVELLCASSLVDDQRKATLCAEIVQQQLLKLSNLDDAEGLSEQQANEFVSELPEEISAVVSKVFEPWPLEQESIDQLKQIAKLLVYKLDCENEMNSGLVIAGFGQQEFFPVMQTLVVTGKYCDVFKWKVSGGERIDNTNQALIKAFPDNRVVSGFLTGRYPELCLQEQGLGRVVDALSTEFERLRTTLNDIKARKIPTENLLYQLSRGENLLAQYEFLVQSRVKEVLNILATRPIAELARIARSLAQLSLIEQKLSLKINSLAKHIDVALITKDDGFNWVNQSPQFA